MEANKRPIREHEFVAHCGHFVYWQVNLSLYAADGSSQNGTIESARTVIEPAE